MRRVCDRQAVFEYGKSVLNAFVPSSEAGKVPCVKQTLDNTCGWNL